MLDAADLVGRMLKWVPSDRISAQEAMMHPFLEDTKINIAQADRASEQ